MRFDERVRHSVPSDLCERGAQFGAFLALVGRNLIFGRMRGAGECCANLSFE
jgi:hypothetical protein